MAGKLPKLFIFDFDGTIVDSANIVCHLLNNMRRERGLLPLSLDALKPHLSRGGNDLVGYALEIPSEVATELVREFRSRYAQLPPSDNILYPLIRETLESLRTAGSFICICTNKPRNLVEKILQETHLEHHFDFINAGGDLPHKKPHVSNMQACLDFFHVHAKEAILIGDSLVDQLSSASTNVPFFFFLGGYADGVNSKKAQFVFQSYADLLSYFGLHFQ